MTAPTLNSDGTITALLTNPVYRLGAAQLLTLDLPANAMQAPFAGRYWLARCGAQTDLERAEHWSIYLRRSVFTVSYGYTNHRTEQKEGQTSAELLVPDHTDPGYGWLAALPAGATLNLLGPFGQPFILQPHSRNLLLLSDAVRAPALLALIDPMLDRRGRVTLVLNQVQTPAPELLARLPRQVELRPAATPVEWQRHLDETLRWADQVCAALPTAHYPLLAENIRRQRFRVDKNFAQVLVESTLACGVGACLACVVPLPDGSHTRACIHGPVFDLAQISQTRQSQRH